MILATCNGLRTNLSALKNVKPRMKLIFVDLKNDIEFTAPYEPFLWKNTWEGGYRFDENELFRGGFESAQFLAEDVYGSVTIPRWY